MSQEFVTELNDEEVKLNEEINVLLNGIDFQQSLSQEKSLTCIPSSFPEENGFTSEQLCEVRGPKPQLLVFIHLTLIFHSELKINLDVHPS